MANENSIKRGPRFKDIAGQVFGSLTVLECVGKNKDGHILWLCACECGNERVTAGRDLRSGRTVRCKQCKSRTHGMSNSPEYSIWACMIHRCTNPDYRQWELYGGRGIKVCERWRSFEAFYEDMGPRPSPKHSIDRFPDNDGDYEPENCRWATDKEQSCNTRKNRILTFNGKTLPLSEWAAELGIKANALRGRLQRGWSVELALTAPLHHRPSSH